MRKAIVLVIGMIMLLGGCCLAFVVSRPCSRLDLALNYTGCLRQLDIEGVHFDGVFTHDLTMFGSATLDGMIIWQMSDGKKLHTTSGLDGVFSANGAFFIGDSNYPLDTVSVWRTQDWVLQTTLDTDARVVSGIALAPDTASLAVVGQSGGDGLVQIWRTSDRRLLHTLRVRKRYVQSVAYSPDSTILASGGRGRKVRLWDLEDGSLLNTLQASSVVQKVIFAPDGLTLASAEGTTVQIWRTDDGTLLHTLTGHSVYVRDITYSPDGSILASADDLGVVRLWDAKKGVQLRSWRDNWMRVSVYAVAFSSDGNLLATAQLFGPVRFYDVQQLLGEAIVPTDRVKTPPN